MSDPSLIRWFEDLTSRDVPSVGGKNASLGEMIHTLEPEGIRVPAGFATTAEAYRRCYASLFTDRAISYREAQGFDHLEVALSVGVQKMVRSDKAGAGSSLRSTRRRDFPTRSSSTRRGESGRAW